MSKTYTSVTIGIAMSLYVVTRVEVPGYDCLNLLDGKGLSRHLEEIDQVCFDIALKPLSGFLGLSANVFDSYETGIDVGGSPQENSEEVWFAPRECLETVSGLLEPIGRTPYCSLATEVLVYDMKALRTILLELQHRSVEFHLSIDW